MEGINDSMFDMDGGPSATLVGIVDVAETYHQTTPVIQGEPMTESPIRSESTGSNNTTVHQQLSRTALDHSFNAFQWMDSHEQNCSTNQRPIHSGKSVRNLCGELMEENPFHSSGTGWYPMHEGAKGYFTPFKWDAFKRQTVASLEGRGHGPLLFVNNESDIRLHKKRLVADPKYRDADTTFYWQLYGATAHSPDKKIVDKFLSDHSGALAWRAMKRWNKAKSEWWWLCKAKKATGEFTEIKAKAYLVDKNPPRSNNLWLVADDTWYDQVQEDHARRQGRLPDSAHNWRRPPRGASLAELLASSAAVAGDEASVPEPAWL